MTGKKIETLKGDKILIQKGNRGDNDLRILIAGRNTRFWAPSMELFAEWARQKALAERRYSQKGMLGHKIITELVYRAVIESQKTIREILAELKTPGYEEYAKIDMSPRFEIYPFCATAPCEHWIVEPGIIRCGIGTILGNMNKCPLSK